MKKRFGLRLWQLFAIVFVAWWCLTGTARSQEARTSAQGIPYVTGGVGYDERAAMEALAGAYNLKIEFAKRGGDYLGDVRLTVRGPVSLEAISDGPIFLVKLPPGTYSLTAVAGTAAKMQTVTVNAAVQKTVVFFW